MTYQTTNSFKDQVVFQAVPLFMVAMLSSSGVLGGDFSSLQQATPFSHSRSHQGLRYTPNRGGMQGRGKVLTAPVLRDQSRSARPHDPRFKNSRNVRGVVVRAAEHAGNNHIFESAFNHLTQHLYEMMGGKASWFYMDMYVLNNKVVKDPTLNQPVDILALQKKASASELANPPKAASLKDAFVLFDRDPKIIFDEKLAEMKAEGFTKKNKGPLNFTEEQKRGAYEQTLKLLGLAHSLGNISSVEDEFMREVVGKIYYVFDLRGPGGFAEDTEKSSLLSPEDANKALSTRIFGKMQEEFIDTVVDLATIHPEFKLWLQTDPKTGEPLYDIDPDKDEKVYRLDQNYVAWQFIRFSFLNSVDISYVTMKELGIVDSISEKGKLMPGLKSEIEHRYECAKRTQRWARIYPEFLTCIKEIKKEQNEIEKKLQELLISYHDNWRFEDLPTKLQKQIEPLGSRSFELESELEQLHKLVVDYVNDPLMLVNLPALNHRTIHVIK